MHRRAGPNMDNIIISIASATKANPTARERRSWKRPNPIRSIAAEIPIVEVSCFATIIKILNIISLNAKYHKIDYFILIFVTNTVVGKLLNIFLPLVTTVAISPLLGVAIVSSLYKMSSVFLSQKVGCQHKIAKCKGVTQKNFINFFK